MREFLGKQYNPFSFPPPGSHFKRLHMAQSEELMTFIDRRMQMRHSLEVSRYFT